MWTCSAASCDFTWITTTGTKKGQKGNKENKQIEPDFLQTLWASEPKGFLLWSRQTRDCLDEMRCDAFIFFWGYDTQHSAETLITRRWLLLLYERQQNDIHQHWNMKHETWDMRHETWDRLMCRSRWSKSTLMTSDSILQGIKTQHFILHSLGKSTGSTLTWICLSV